MSNKLNWYSKFSSLMNFQSLNHLWSVFFLWSHCTSAWQGGDKRKRRWREGWGRGDCWREVIILSISAVKGGWFFKGGDQSRDGYYSRKYGMFSILSPFKFDPIPYNKLARIQTRYGICQSQSLQCFFLVIYMVLLSKVFLFKLSLQARLQSQWNLFSLDDMNYQCGLLTSSVRLICFPRTCLKCRLLSWSEAGKNSME